MACVLSCEDRARRDTGGGCHKRKQRLPPLQSPHQAPAVSVSSQTRFTDNASEVGRPQCSLREQSATASHVALAPLWLLRLTQHSLSSITSMHGRMMLFTSFAEGLRTGSGWCAGDAFRCLLPSGSAVHSGLQGSSALSPRFPAATSHAGLLNGLPSALQQPQTWS